ncbi:MAG: DUF1049 domain-containing protein, partial [Deltaproteobacteria bacterium]|nr:DUF1049 domain-containing protein [Deltaproteobacteria bacterium]
MKILRTLLYGLLLAATITFSLKNYESVRLRYFHLIDSVELPLFLVVLLSVLFGMAAGGLLDAVMRLRLRRAIQREKKTMEELE